ncbi:MAG: methyltransferase domain-containing protein [Candidatus Lindowbacteria bacterium]|nr:methyltransferase domain-containing protein [Candidatus Lindowbacteria bacterium]
MKKVTSPKCPLCKAPDTLTMYHKKDIDVFACRACALAFAWPQLSEAELQRLYGSSYYESWGIESDPTVRDMKKRTFELRLKALEELIPPGRILDVGCATGFFLEAATERGWQAYGVEVNPHAVEQGRKQFGDCLVRGTLEDAPFERASFDAIAMSDVLEHVSDPMAALHRANELLRENGLLAITTPNIAGFGARLLRGRWPHLKAEHHFYFSPRALSRVLTGDVCAGAEEAT